MKQTVVGVFDRYAAAQHAARTLEDSGFDHDHVHVTGTDETDTSVQARDDDTRRDEGVFASIRSTAALLAPLALRAPKCRRLSSTNV